MKKLLLSVFAVSAMMTQAQSWIAQPTNFPANYGIDEMVIIDANTVWTFPYDGSGTANSYPKMVGRTTNGGATWTASAVSGPGSNALFSDIAAIDANTAWIVTAPFAAGTNANRVWKTTNGGTSWTQQLPGYTSASFANHVYFWDANNGWTSGDPTPAGSKFEMYKTSNGGTSWTAITTAPTAISTDEFTYVGIKKVLGDHIWVGTSQGRILHSPDRGATWTAAYSPVLDFGGVITTGSSGEMAFSSASKGLLIAVDGAGSPATATASLYESSDGGANWDLITPTGTFYSAGISYVPGTANTYVTTGSNFQVTGWMGSAYSTDGGHTWTSIDTDEQRTKVQFLNPTTGWAGQFSDGPAGTKGIMKFSGNLALATSETAVKSALKVYPNPATDVVNVTSNKKIEYVNIIDLSGKRVDGAKGSQINVSNLAKGTYILQVNYGGGAVENTKLIKK